VELDSLKYTIELEHSVLTGKKRLFKNSCLIYEEKSLRKLFNYEFKIANHLLLIAQLGEKFDLRIDNESFMFVYNKTKQDLHFKFEGL